MKGTVAAISNVLKEFADRAGDPYIINCVSCSEGKLVYQGGCANCDSCGYSECG